MTEDWGVPVAEWPTEIDEHVLIFVVHPNAKYARTEEELSEWQHWTVGQWIDHNGGGWTYYGMIGTVTHVAPLPAVPKEHRWPAK